MKLDVYVVFDIGKTNKKMVLFDLDFNVILQNSVEMEEVEDEEGFPCENIDALTLWILKSLDLILASDNYEVKGLNFSTYGATLVHLNSKDERVFPVYNYLKPYPEQLLKQFTAQHDLHGEIAIETASPTLGMLNSGLQLYWLKQEKGSNFRSLDCSLHFPQYLSFLLTQKKVSDYTSIGCHTMLWNYRRNQYHEWLVKEQINEKLAPIVSTKAKYQVAKNGKEFDVGVGIHDSSAALVPYIFYEQSPFVLLSTGTWSIAMNPFNSQNLTAEELNNDCLQYLGIAGQNVRAARLFLGKEHEHQAQKLAQHFSKPTDYYKQVEFDVTLAKKMLEKQKLIFQFENIPAGRYGFLSSESDDSTDFPDFESGYHQLMFELCRIQVKALELAIGNSEIQKIFIDGGFAANKLFVGFLAELLPQYEWIISKKAVGSAFGAALLLSDEDFDASKIKKQYGLQKYNSPDKAIKEL